MTTAESLDKMEKRALTQFKLHTRTKNQSNMRTKNLFGILILFLFTLLSFLGGEKCLKGGEKILGTATIKDQNYKEFTVWAWNFQGYPSYRDFIYCAV